MRIPYRADLEAVAAYAGALAIAVVAVLALSHFLGSTPPTELQSEAARSVARYLEVCDAALKTRSLEAVQVCSAAYKAAAEELRRPNDDCLKLVLLGESHGFLDRECGWIGDRLYLQFYAHGLSGGETAQGL